MPIQQLSYGGASAPVAAPVSVGTSPTTSATTTVPTLTSLTQTGNFEYLFPDLDLSQANASLDPYQNTATSSGYSTAGSESPGYQQFGTGWYDFLSALNTPNPNYVAPPVDASAGSGGNAAYAAQVKQAQAADPLSTGEVQQGYGSNLASEIVSEYNFGGGPAGNNPTALVAQALPTVASSFGVDPSSPQAQELTQMFITDALQRNVQEGLLGTYDQPDILQRVTTGIAEAAAFAAAGGIAGWVAPAAGAAGAAAGGAAAAADTGAIAADAGTAADVGATAADTGAVVDAGSATEGVAEAGETGLSEAGQQALFSLISHGLGAAHGLTSGDPLSEISSVLSLAGSGNSFYDASTASTPGTTGTNAPSSGGITSSISNALGLSPDQFNTDLTALKTAGTAAGVAVPLIEGAVNAPGNLNLSTPTSTPVATPAAAPLTPDAMGEPLSSEPIDNPAESSYTPPANQNAQSLQRLLYDMGGQS